MRRAAKKDSTQAAIVDALRKEGYEVTILNQEGIPDLLVTASNWVAPGRSCYAFFMLLETKSKRRKDGSIALRKEQKKQNDFCAKFGVRYVTTPQEALDALK